MKLKRDGFRQDTNLVLQTGTSSEVLIDRGSKATPDDYSVEGNDSIGLFTDAEIIFKWILGEIG
jgi:hypothetical protein